MGGPHVLAVGVGRKQAISHGKMRERLAFITRDSASACAEPNDAVGRAHNGDNVIIGQVVFGGEIHKVTPIEKRNPAFGGNPKAAVGSAIGGENVDVDKTIGSRETL